MQSLGIDWPSESVVVERWSTERPLLAFVVIASAVIWLCLLVTIIGLVYAVLIGLFVFASQVVFVAHLRGSAVRLGPDQFPDLHRRVEELAGRIGLREVPVVYVIQAGGALNALATKFFATNFIVLFSDLLDACGENLQARDMIIGHELGHLRAGHLKLRWFLLPGLSVPFLGGAYSRAREYTCDRFGMAVCEDRRAALQGLAILAAGGHHGPQVNLQALARQSRDMGSSWMTIGRWLATHPPLAHRVAALEPELADVSRMGSQGALGAVAIVGTAAALLCTIPAGLIMLTRSGVAAPVHPAIAGRMDPDGARRQAESDIARLAEFVESYRRDAGGLPQDTAALYQAWRLRRLFSPAPVDPFDGYRYGYEVKGDDFHIWSAGPEKQDPADDIYFESRKGAFR